MQYKTELTKQVKLDALRDVKWRQRFKRRKKSNWS